MQKAPLPNNEPERLEELLSYEILDTLPEAAYDDITQLASYIAETPIALISLVDRDRQWFKSKVGIDASDTSRDVAFCAHAILEPSDIFVVQDTLDDLRFCDNPLVLQDPHIRFYAGAPLVTSKGNALGTLCVIDRKPREMSPRKREALRVLARQVVAQLELRRIFAELSRNTAELEKTHRNLLSILEQVQIGTLLLDSGGRVVFMSMNLCRVMGLSYDQIRGQAWQTLLSFDADARQELERMIEAAAPTRNRLPLTLQSPGQRRLEVECEVAKDAQDPTRRILYFYFIAEGQEVHTQLRQSSVMGIDGTAPCMMSLFKTIEQIAKVESTVLIEGETGTGKELVARAIHAASRRKKGPFIAVNCGVLNETLLASQLFGHRRGAFTGAVADQEGFFEAANQGTLFLDEIGELPLPMQTSLLRVLEERAIARVGEVRSRPVDIRLLVATHKNLEAEVKEKRFREDLFYRLRVARIRVPPLRERKEDIPLLASLFVTRNRKAFGNPNLEIHGDALRLLMEHDWPGNVRELLNSLEYSAIHSDGRLIRPRDLPPEIRAPSKTAAASEDSNRLETLGEIDKDHFLSALNEARGNRSRAARILGVSRSTFYRRLKELGLESD